MTLNESGLDQADRIVTISVRDHWKLFLIEGIVLVILGCLAVAVPPIASLAVEIVIGWIFLVSGLVGLFTTYMMRGLPGFWWSLLSAILAILAGIVLLAWPLTGILSLTLVLIVFFVIEGVASIMYALDHRSGLTGGERGYRSHLGGHYRGGTAGKCRLGDRHHRRGEHVARRGFADRDCAPRASERNGPHGLGITS